MRGDSKRCRCYLLLVNVITSDITYVGRQVFQLKVYSSVPRTRSFPACGMSGELLLLMQSWRNLTCRPPAHAAGCLCLCCLAVLHLHVCASVLFQSCAGRSVCSAVWVACATRHKLGECWALRYMSFEEHTSAMRNTLLAGKLRVCCCPVACCLCAVLRDTQMRTSM